MDFITSQQVLWIAATGLATLLFIIVTMGFFGGGNHMPVDGKTVLLTGASEGMGLCVAKRLAAKGANLIIVSRSVPKLEAALEEIKVCAKNPSSQRFRFIPADVSVDGYAPAVIAEAVRWNNGQALDVVWCIAGWSQPELFLDTDPALLRRHMDVNYFGAAGMAHAALGEWLAPDAPVDEKVAKHLVFTSSTLSYYSVAGYAAYSPAKYAIRGLAETLAQEVMLYPQNVKVHVVYPGTILTDSFAREELTRPEITRILEAEDPQQQPDEVAERAIRGLENGQHSTTINWLGELMRLSVVGGTIRDNWLYDFFGAILVQFVWIFVLPDMHGKIRKHRKKYGHPSNNKKEAPQQ
jgi:3-dehydrosphinganine reductase